MIPENPYESPSVDPAPLPPSKSRRILKTCCEALGVLLFGTIIGTLLGMFLCAMLSGGHAAGFFYYQYGIFGAVVGILGSVLSGIVIALVRFGKRGGSS